MLKSLRMLMVTLFAGALLACNPVAVLGGTEEEIATFHARISSDDIDAIWRDTSPQLREVVTRDAFYAVMEEQRATMGEFVSSDRASFNINTYNGVTSAAITMESEYANGAATENFTFIQRAEEWELAFYDIQSPLYLEASEPQAEPNEDAVEAKKVVTD